MPDTSAVPGAVFPPRVVVVHPSGELYGSDRVTAESVRAFVDAGCSVVTILHGAGPLVTELEAAGSTVRVIRAPVLRRASLSVRGALGLAGDLVRAAPHLRRLLRDLAPDVVYVSTLTLPWWLLAARRAGVAVVCHVHEAEDRVALPVRLGLALPLLWADRVVANSRYARATLLRDVGRLATRTVVVDNPVPGPGSEPSPPRAALDGEIRLVQVGRISTIKATDVTVRAVRLLLDTGIDVRLDLVGAVAGGNESFEEWVRAIAEEDGTSARIRWHGFTPDVFPALGRADLALVPSRAESCGNAALEAMLARRPVVVSDTPGLRDVVDDGDLGTLCVPGDPTDLARAVLAVVRTWSDAVGRTEHARSVAAGRHAPGRYRVEISDIVVALARDLTRR